MSRKVLDWSLTVGYYPGILFGIRTYKEPMFDEHVLYLPFVDISVTFYFTEEDGE